MPYWPLGLPAWDDPWIALALRASTVTYLTVWRRGGDATTILRLPQVVSAELLYPSTSQAVFAVDRAELTVTLPTSPSAVLLRLRTEGN